MARVIDELWVKVYYNHPTMSAYSWDRFPHNREEAADLLSSLRKKGFFVHYWP